MTVSTEWFVAICGIGVLVIGGIGLLLAIIFILTDDYAFSAEEEERATMRRIAAELEEARRIKFARWARRVARRHGKMIGGTAVAIVLATIKIYADDPNGACTEATLREFWGDNWLIGWYLLGCYLLPG